ncbi:MAG: ABC transporter ATP-binding protein [Geminicoccaceae bacterium]
MLTVEGLQAGYGSASVLFGVDLTIGAGEISALLGRNGMGKTTSVRAITGQIPVRAGVVRLDQRPLEGLPAHKIARAGIGLVPEGRQIFRTLSVEENLLATARPGPWSLRRIQDLFPVLAERRRAFGHQLSGGEQQMLAISRALMTNPKLLIMDEATEGLAPLLRQRIWEVVGILKAEGQAILLIDPDLEAVLRVTDRWRVLEKGRVVLESRGQPTMADKRELRRRLSV